jgi:hypothetical protein
MKPRHLPLLLILLCSNSIAKDIDGYFAVLSAGGDSCSAYLSARTGGEDSQQVYVTWLSGYFSAFNQIVASTYNILGSQTPDEVMRQLDTYCTMHQDAIFVNAVAEITLQLFATRANLAPDKDNRVKWNNLDAGVN